MIKKKGCLWFVYQLPLVVYWRESIFEYEYLREYEAKIENTLTLVWGPYVVLLGMNN